MPRVKLVKATPPKRGVKLEDLGDLEDVELESEPTDDEIETSEKIADFQAKFSGKQYKIRIERFNPAEAEWEWVTRLPLEGFEPFNVLPKYGGGKYKAVLMDEGGRYVKGGIMEFRFSVPVEPAAPDKPRSALDDPAVVMMLENQKQQSLMLMEILKTSLPVQAANANKGLDAAQLMDMLGKFAALTAPKESGMKSLVEMMNVWEKFKETLAPEEKESGGIVSEIKEAIGALALLPQIRGMAQNPVGLPPAPPRILSPNAPVAMPSGASPHASNGAASAKQKAKTASPAAQKILFYVPKIEEAARENQDVERWAERVLDILDQEVIPALVKEYNGFVSEDSIYDRLIAGAENPEEREQIFIHAPALLPYKDWVYRVIDEALKSLETPDPENPSEPETAR